MKKIISILIMAAMLITQITTAFAYTPGEVSIDIDLSDYKNLYNATVDSGVLTIAEGGKATYQLYIPFDAVSLSLNCTADVDGTTLTMVMDNDVQTFNLSSNMNLDLTNVLKKGEHQIAFIPSNPIDLYKVTFTKADRDQKTSVHDYSTAPDLTAFEDAIQTAFILSPDSSVMFVNGGKRYVNNDDAREVPYVENGEMYLPVHSFARTFGYYYEEKENELVLMKENIVFLLKDGKFTKQVDFKTPVAIDNVIKNVNGKKYVPIRYFAEIDGKTVTKKDNFYIVEYPSLAKKILQKDIYNELVSKFSPYYLEANTGTTYYVSKECVACDENDGSYEKPFKTIAKAAEIAKAGDTVIIDGGTYYETLAPKNDGTASLPITFKAAEGETVTLSATAPLGDPVGQEGDMLIYDILTDLSKGDADFIGMNQIFYKSKNLNAARHPNKDTKEVWSPKKEGLSPEWPTRGNILLSGADKYVAVSTTDLEQEKDFWKGGTFVGFKGSAWCLEMAKIESSEPGKLYLRDGSITWWHAKDSHTDDYGYITDCKNAIDLPGEWAIENGKLYILPPEGETAETLYLEQKVRQVVVDIADRKFIRIEGIDTFGGGAKLNESEMCLMSDGEYSYLSHYTYSLDQREGFIDKRDIFNPKGSPMRGEQGFYIGGTDNIIINNKFSYSAASAIYTTGKYGYFEDNYIHDCGYMSSYVGGFFCATKGWEEPDTPRGGNLVVHNTVVNAGRHVYGLATHEAWYADGNTTLPGFLPEEVSYNYFGDGCLASRDTGTFYMHGCLMGTDRKWSQHHHNIIENAWGYKTVVSAGYYYDGYASIMECYDNIIMYSDETIPYTTAIYQQPATTAPSLTDQWNNETPGLVEGGVDALTVDDYPDGKIFRSGAKMLAEDMTPYLNSLDIERDFIYATEGIASSGATIEDGIFKPSKAGDYICFKDVDFTEGQNVVSLYCTGDRYNSGEEVTIVIGKSLTDYYVKQKAKVDFVASYDWARLKMTTAIIGYIPKEKTNVYIVADDAKSFGLERMRWTYEESEYANVRTSVYAIDGEVVSGSMTASTEFPAGETYNFMKNTFGSVVAYKGVEVKRACDTFYTRIGSAGSHANQLFYLRIGSPTGEIVAEAREMNGSWNDFTPRQFKCNKTIEPGTYDFYITFEEPSKSSNFFWWGLGVAGDTEEQTEAVQDTASEESAE